ncbi:acyl-CoA desaturase [Cryobacterium sp.]|jgi:fatty acid desaturase|uniref:fatty acid desaturase family protein n=1 Tax=Cryobacterium sp. TaxID=1926290 RepID=UPI002608F51A|nr:acyl-CoA desaturase [Cryobacterium sp.]MCU1446126.1 delta fatty acid desaturase [Cryobacterium sp.]
MSEASAAPTVRIVRTRKGGDSKNPTTEYSSLLHTVRNLDLLQRATAFYWGVFAALVLITAGLGVGFVLLGDSWYQLIIAGVLGIILTQFAFLAHEASHRQVFESGPANDRAGRILANLFVGISYAWWMTKHSRHHANPNVVGKDPDIEPDVIRFNEKDASEVNWLTSFITRKQGYLFFPLLTLEGINLHIHGFKTVFGKGRVDKRWLEITMLTSRIVIYFAVIFYFLPLGMAFAFIGVQMAVFGVYMGASFAPNHKGMPQLPHESKVDFLRRQVLTSRNIRGGSFMDTFMGGLNYQVEHHLFPNMARPHLKKAQEITKEYCESNKILYTETGLFESYGIVIAYLNKVGLAARDPFDCPMVQRFHHR